MGKLNGTLLLLYADGEVIAAQKGCSINVEQDLPDASNKESAGWSEHINGLRNASVDFDALFSTTGISAGELMDYIFNRKSLLISIVGGLNYPIVAEADMGNIKIDAPMEGAVALSGNIKINGSFYSLRLGNELIDQSSWYTAAYWSSKAACWSQDGVTLKSDGGSGSATKNSFFSINHKYRIRSTCSVLSANYLGITDGVAYPITWDSASTKIVS
jgi:hypothetical protein